MGTVLFNPPPEEMVEHPFLIHHMSKNKFEPYLKGTAAYVARRFLADVFAQHMAQYQREFWPAKADEFERLITGTGNPVYWEVFGGNFHRAVSGGQHKPSNIRMHSVIGPMALAEHRYADSIVSAFILNYLCLGGGIAPMTSKDIKFNDAEKQLFHQVTEQLRAHLKEALANPAVVFEELVKYSQKGRPE